MPSHARPVIVGSGYIAGRHAAALAAIGIRPAGFWSPNPESRERIAAQWGAVASSSLDELMSIEGATHAHICSPPMQHEEAIAIAVQHGLAIVTEKPLAPTGEAARRIAELIAAGGVDAWLTFNRRLDGGIQELRKVIASGQLGTPVSVFGSYRQQWNAAPSARDWRFNPELVGPSRVIAEIGSHWLDLAEFVLGQEIASVNAFTANMGSRTYDTGSETGEFTPVNEDLFSAQLRFSGGTVGHVYATELAHGTFDDIELHIDGTLRSAVWSSERPDQLSLSHKLEGTTIHGMASDTSSIESCIKAIYDGTAAEAGVATIAEGVGGAAVMDALRESDESNSWKDVSR